MCVHQREDGISWGLPVVGTHLRGASELPRAPLASGTEGKAEASGAVPELPRESNTERASCS